MTKYYVVMCKKENVATIYFNFQKSVPPIRFRVCTHIQIAPSKWQTVNKSITAWNKYAKSEEGKPIVDERINELCEKYDYNFPVISDRPINDILQQAMKRIAETCPSLMEKHVTVLTVQEKRKEVHFADLLKRKAKGENLHKEGKKYDMDRVSRMYNYMFYHKEEFEKSELPKWCNGRMIIKNWQKSFEKHSITPKTT